MWQRSTRQCKCYLERHGITSNQFDFSCEVNTWFELTECTILLKLVRNVCCGKLPEGTWMNPDKPSSNIVKGKVLID